MDLKGGDATPSGLGATLYGSRRGEWRNPPTFLVEAPGDSQFIVDVEEIGGGDQVLEIAVDGRVAAAASRRGGRRELADTERWVRVPLPAGRHTLRVDNAAAGGDWLRVRSYHFVVEAASGADLVQAHGLGDGTRALIYLENQTYARLPQFLGQQATPLRGVVVTVKGLGAGRYRVTRIDPDTGAPAGTQDVRAEGGGLTLTLPRLEDDTAVRLLRERD